MQRDRNWPLHLGTSSVAVVLGLNEIASAVAIALHRQGCGVVMCHDASIPVIRRGMAFHDAIYGDRTIVAGIEGVAATRLPDVRALLAQRAAVVITVLDLTEILTIGPIAVLVDGRLLKRSVKPDLRNIGRITVGLGPGFTIGSNCDVAIETQPASAGAIITNGTTKTADGISRQLGGVGAERFVYSTEAGCFRTALDVGRRVFRGVPLGRVGDQLVSAPMDGTIRGIVRDGVTVSMGVKLVEIDPRGRRSCWTGIDDRGRTIAEACIRAIAAQDTAQVSGRVLQFDDVR